MVSLKTMAQDVLDRTGLSLGDSSKSSIILIFLKLLLLVSIFHELGALDARSYLNFILFFQNFCRCSRE